MGKHRGGRPQSAKNIDLHAGIGDVILAPDHMRDAEVDVIDNAAQRIEKLPILLQQHGVRQRGQIDGLRPTDGILPAHLGAHRVLRRVLVVGEQKTPMWLAAVGVKFGAIPGAELQGGAVVNRGLIVGELTLAAAVQFIGGLVAGIKPAVGLQLLNRPGVAGKALRLAGKAVPGKAEPGQIGLDCLDEVLARALPVRIINAQQELPTLAPCEQPVQQRGPQIADMQAPGRTRRETDFDGHGRSHRGVDC